MSLPSHVVAIFLAEGEELAQVATRSLLALEAGTSALPGEESPRVELGRAFHTMKGAAGTLGQPRLATLAHSMENVLPPAEAKAIEGSIASVLFRAVDAWTASLRAIGDPALDPPNLDPILDSLARIERGEPPALAVPPAVSEEDVEEAHPAPRADKSVHVGSLITQVERLRELRSRLRGQGLRAFEEEVGDIVHHLEEHVRVLASEPLGPSFEPLRRLVRDLCQSLGKEASLSIIGGELSIDRRVLSVVREAVVQLLRNAVDHGIESPEVRETRGKHRAGLLVVRAEHEGNMLFLEVSDDGRGLDPNEVREIEVKAGHLTEEAARSLADHQVLQAIFRPGWSSRTEVTESAGRGFGMNVVLAAVERLGGRVEVDSRKGQGARFFLTVPLQLGSTFMLVVVARGHELGIPLRCVDRVSMLSQGNLRKRRDGLGFADGDEVIELLSLARLLGADPAHAKDPADGVPVVILRLGSGARRAVYVDAVVGDVDLVLKPLPKEAGGDAIYLGVSTGRDGELVLVLRPEWLFAGEASW